LNRAGIPSPSDATLVRLASIAAQVEELLAPDNPLDKAPVGLKNIKNDRRRAMEAILVLLADSEVRNYLGELEGLGLLPVKR
jgi:hypothetical protein